MVVNWNRTLVVNYNRNLVVNLKRAPISQARFAVGNVQGRSAMAVLGRKCASNYAISQQRDAVFDLVELREKHHGARAASCCADTGGNDG